MDFPSEAVTFEAAVTVTVAGLQGVPELVGLLPAVDLDHRPHRRARRRHRSSPVPGGGRRPSRGHRSRRRRHHRLFLRIGFHRLQPRYQRWSRRMHHRLRLATALPSRDAPAAGVTALQARRRLTFRGLQQDFDLRCG